MDAKDDSKRTTLRLPQDLYDRVEAAAAASKRSLNGEILAALEDRYPRQHHLNDVATCLILLKLALYSDRPDPEQAKSALSNLEESINGLRDHILRGMKDE